MAIWFNLAGAAGTPDPAGERRERELETIEREIDELKRITAADKSTDLTRQISADRKSVV